MAHTMNATFMKERTKRFAITVMKLCKDVPRTDESRVICRQLLRSATSVAANYRAVCRARSTPDFVSKLGIVLEEADETQFWVELLIDSGIVSPEKVKTLLQESNELVAIFVASLRTVKGPNLQSKI